MNESTIILLGASGDLAKRKLIPAIYGLIESGKLNYFLLIGAAKDDITSDQMIDDALPFIKNPKKRIINRLKKYSSYQKLDFADKQGFNSLDSLVSEREKKFKMVGNRLAYCSFPASFFCEVTKSLAESGVIKSQEKEENPWNRIVYEKPFGHDLESAHHINTCISECLYEHQVYRIDHYLTKELVSNIALVRFTNCIFEPLWNNHYIDEVQIVLTEDICIEGRGDYYDKYGAVRDVMQNHMLELLALVAMETPKWLTGEFIRYERAKVLKNVCAVDACFGQYDGYKGNFGVFKDSKTETFAMAYLRVNNPRWAGVPFYLKTGKCIDKKETVIYIKFKHIECLLTKGCPIDSNYLTIKITPDAGFSLSLNIKKPGSLYEVIPVDMEFSHECLVEEKVADSYEVLLLEVIRGEQSVSVRFDEIEYAWNVIDEIKKLKIPLHSYKPGTFGPDECNMFAKKHGMRWLS